jgi:hypothetical protein
MRLVFAALTGQFEKAIAEIEMPIAAAATAAVRDAAEQAKADGRADIAAAGFGKKWQNALRADLFPKNQASMHPAALLRHKIPYAGVFEDGATIGGKPLLWLPLKTVPLGTGGRQLTPRQFIARIGPLVSVNIPGRRPLLVGKGGRSTILRATEKVTRLRKGAVARGIRSVSVPLFVGIEAVAIRKKFHLRDIFSRAGASLGAFYLKNLKV